MTDPLTVFRQIQAKPLDRQIQALQFWEYMTQLESARAVSERSESSAS